MTSKVALWKIFETAFRQGKVVVDLREQYEQVLKDLEVLDILKENIVECVGDSAGNEYLKLLLHKFGNEETYFKLKEWLENEQNKSS